MDWAQVERNLRILVRDNRIEWLNNGQKNSLLEVSSRIVQNGIIIADEVGMGKTRIALATAMAVLKSGGRVAIIIPPGLYYQWREEISLTIKSEGSDLVRSLKSFYDKCPVEGWFSENLVFISHNFGNWRLGSHYNKKYLALFPELYAFVRKEEDGRLPWGYRDMHKRFGYEKAKEMAEKIVNESTKHGYFQDIINLMPYDSAPWGKDLIEGEEYSVNGKFRLSLEKSVGAALGRFDLVIVDEAHKSKNDMSGLSKILGNIINTSSPSRTIGLTATPVELETDDWTQILNRIKAGDINQIKEVIDEYVKVVSKVRKNWRFEKSSIEEFKYVSGRFKKALSKYVIRRDKSEDESIQLYEQVSQSPWRTYREEREIGIRLDDPIIDEKWRKAVMAAEALSYVVDLKNNPALKRLRLSLANGHGLAALIDSKTANEGDHEFIQLNSVEEDIEDKLDKAQGKLNTRERKANERTEFWLKRMYGVIKKENSALFNHPVILRVSEIIEKEYVSKGLKVLVFGRFNKPLKVLTLLLNAREMLRLLDKGKFWPQFSIDRRKGSLEEIAIKSAIQQLKGELENKWTMEAVESALARNERRIENLRAKFRRMYLKVLKKEWASELACESSVFARLYRDVIDMAKRDSANNRILSRALYERLKVEAENGKFSIEWGMLYPEFKKMLEAMLDNDRDEFTDNDGVEVDLERQIYLIFERLEDEFSGRTPRFARFMFGETEMHTRRIIQQSFNNPDSFLQVLVAQSKVGKEGLNLHKACSTVIMMHPEWNPGPAEQEIGRVDRVNSYWSTLIKQHKPDQAEVPRILFRPVVFKDTYDEYNWKVLRRRWDDFKAQLHGLVISDSLAENGNDEETKLIEELNGHAPSFAPKKVY